MRQEHKEAAYETRDQVQGAAQARHYLPEQKGSPTWSVCSAAPQSGYDLSWYTIDDGGAMFSAGGLYSLGGTIGQSDAGALSGGSYQLNGGFWGGASINYNIYLPLTLKNF